MENLWKKQQRKARSLSRNLERKAKTDNRTVSERGYDACVLVGKISAQSGSNLDAVSRC